MPIGASWRLLCSTRIRSFFSPAPGNNCAGSSALLTRLPGRGWPTTSLIPLSIVHFTLSSAAAVRTSRARTSSDTAARTVISRISAPNFLRSGNNFTEPAKTLVPCSHTSLYFLTSLTFMPSFRNRLIRCKMELPSFCIGCQISNLKLIVHEQKDLHVQTLRTK